MYYLCAMAAPMPSCPTSSFRTQFYQQNTVLVTEPWAIRVGDPLGCTGQWGQGFDPSCSGICAPDYA